MSRSAIPSTLLFFIMDFDVSKVLFLYDSIHILLVTLKNLIYFIYFIASQWDRPLFLVTFSSEGECHLDFDSKWLKQCNKLDFENVDSWDPEWLFSGQGIWLAYGKFRFNQQYFFILTANCQEWSLTTEWAVHPEYSWLCPKAKKKKRKEKKWFFWVSNITWDFFYAWVVR